MSSVGLAFLLGLFMGFSLLLSAYAVFQYIKQSKNNLSSKPIRSFKGQKNTLKELFLIKKETCTYFERLDEHLQLLNHKIDGLLLYPEQSVKVSQFMQAQREQLAEDLKQGMTDSFHSLEPDDVDNSSLSLPTRDEAIEAAVQRFAKEMAWEHSLHYLQKQVNVNGVLLEVTLGIVGDAVGNSTEPYQWPTTAKAGMSTDDTGKETHHA